MLWPWPSGTREGLSNRPRRHDTHAAPNLLYSSTPREGIITPDGFAEALGGRKAVVEHGFCRAKPPVDIMIEDSLGGTMPRSIGEPTKVVSFTLTPTQIEALNALAKREGMNRSEWIRRQINMAAPLVSDLNGCDHLPVVRNERARSWWVRLGKSNPNRVGGHCVKCWGETAPVRRRSWGKTTWILEDGTEVME
jgi:hypothetical protein